MPKYTAEPRVENVFLNKNFCHLPIVLPPKLGARDWTKRSTGYDRYLHPDKHGKPRVILWLPSTVSPRCPSPGDMDVLLRLGAVALREYARLRHLAAWEAGGAAIKAIGPDRNFYSVPLSQEARAERYLRRRCVDEAAADEMLMNSVSNKGQYLEGLVGACSYGTELYRLRREGAGQEIPLEFPSVRAMVLALGLPTNDKGLRRVRQALDLWSNLAIARRGWYVARNQKSERQGNADKRVDKIFDPFVDKLTMPRPGERGPVCLTLTANYMATLLGYVVNLELPLPCTSAAAFNLLCVLEAWNKTQPKRDVVTPALIGLGHLKPSEAAKRIVAARGDVNRHLAKANSGHYYDGKFKRVITFRPNITCRNRKENAE